MSRRYIVVRKEVHDSYVAIEADSAEEAVKKVAEGEGTEITCEYSRTMDPETWNVDHEFWPVPSSFPEPEEDMPV